MSREHEVATLLRADAALVALLPGGIYAAGDLGQAGITDPQTTPQAYQGGRLRPTAVVRARAPVPNFQFVSLRDRHASMNQTVVVYLYARENTATLITAHDVVYSLLHGERLSNAWSATWSDSLGPQVAPELVDAQLVRCEFLIVSIRRPVPV